MFVLTNFRWLQYINGNRTSIDISKRVSSVTQTSKGVINQRGGTVTSKSGIDHRPSLSVPSKTTYHTRHTTQDTRCTTQDTRARCDRTSLHYHPSSTRTLFLLRLPLYRFTHVINRISEDLVSTRDSSLIIHRP